MWESGTLDYVVELSRVIFSTSFVKLKGKWIANIRLFLKLWAQQFSTNPAKSKVARCLHRFCCAHSSRGYCTSTSLLLHILLVYNTLCFWMLLTWAADLPHQNPFLRLKHSEWSLYTTIADVHFKKQHKRPNYYLQSA